MVKNINFEVNHESRTKKHESNPYEEKFDQKESYTQANESSINNKKIHESTVETSSNATKQEQESQKIELISTKLLESFHATGKSTIIGETICAITAFLLDGGYRTDYLAHFGAGSAELLRDFVLEPNKIPKVLEKPLLLLTKLFNIKDEQGNDLKVENLHEHKERIFGAASILQGIPFLGITLIKPTLQYLKNKPDKPELGVRKILSMIFNAVTAPITVLISCPVGKIQRTLAPLLLKLNPEKDELYKQSMTSGNDHWLRGIQSVTLAISQLSGNLLPKLNPLIESSSGAFVSGLSIKHGLEMLNPKDKDEKLEKQAWDQGFFSDNIVYSWSQKVFKLISKGKLKLPDLELIREATENYNQGNITKLSEAMS
ncbi:MAG: hypothetical protein HRT47_13090 [Candidatus Caenarcaniphilales bacterium]|nr:hypothetical protein [Candidatus Caenarcaniphilales bacterium]